MKTVIADQEQTIIDIAIQEAGTVEAAFDIAAKLDQGITSRIRTVELPEFSVLDADVLNYCKQKGLKPVSTSDQLQQGIGYWEIENDFIVQ